MPVGDPRSNIKKLKSVLRKRNEKKGHTVMKKLISRLGAVALVVAMLCSMAIFSNAAITNPTVAFNNVAAGDTVNAYKLVSYAADYNSYVFDADFETFLNTKKPGAANLDTFFSGLSSDLVAQYLDEYITLCSAPEAQYKLPAVYKSETVAVGSTSVSMDLEPGYYLFLAETTETNSNLYKPTSVFVQAKNGNINVYAGGSNEALTAPYAVTLKSENAPTITKRVEDAKGSWLTATGAEVGQTMKFYVKIDIPNYKNVSNLNLTLKDTLTNLEFVDGSMKVYSKLNNDNEFNAADEITDAVTAVNASAYAAGTQTVDATLSYKAIKAANATATSVYVVYEAKFTADAVVVADKANNSVVLEYANAATPNEKKTTDSSETDVFTYSFKLDKVDETGDKTLAGAEFTFYRDTTLTETVKFVKVGDYYRPATEAEIASEDVEKVEAVPADFLIKGLDVGYYYVKETKIPVGYYSPASYFTVDLKGERGANATLNGKLLNTSTFVENDAADRLLVKSVGVNAEKTNQLDVVLKNSSTPILPTTGGTGTVIFTVCGIALMALAVIALVLVRRKKKEN